MFLETLFSFSQKVFEPVYNNSYFLKKIDWLIGIDIMFLILSTTTAQSDFIGYFGIFAILLTFVKLLTKKNTNLEFSVSDKFLLAYFVIVLISVAGSSLFYLSLKGFFKTITYLGFYISAVCYFKDNRDKIKYFFWAYAVCLIFESAAA